MSFWYGARALKEAPYMEDYAQIEKDFPNFSFHLALDRPDPEADKAGVKYTAGFVHNVLYENYLKNHEEPEGCIYLMCGPPMCRLKISSTTTSVRSLSSQESRSSGATFFSLGGARCDFGGYCRMSAGCRFPNASAGLCGPKIGFCEKFHTFVT